ncbi:nitrate reductase [Dechloromonas denitrificans]|uniref:nitrate reductase n=1 Tax=Dechloromonas denitrificans TaxID=281362 RepID=UPI001CF92144|nr:nitrate reductase [Dechloromonas denitrificans]UCV02924.1 molybdopterin-dependent oxidoreductase [Dechloromonas denitrificans]
MQTEVKSTCCYCGVGCGVLIKTENGKIEGVRGDPEHPANRGRLCTKGATLHLTADPGGRLLYPESRAVRGQVGERVAWDGALDAAAERFAETIRRYGPDSVAFYISGQLMTEDYYVFNKLAKGLIGTNNVDTNSRLCMSSAVAGYKQTLGVDAPPCSYADIAQAGVIFIAGANPAIAHPIVFRYIEDARAANPDLKIIVADPRRSESAEIADLHLPLKPGSDIALFNGMLHVLIEEGLVDHAYIAAHTNGFAELAERVRNYSPTVVADLCGIPAAAIIQAARWFAGHGPVLSLYCQGLNQSAHGTHNNAGIIHLHLATGQIGKAGAGPFSLTGQPNAMGGREVGGLANLLSAHRDLDNPEHRAEVARLWGVSAVPEKPGKSAVDLFASLKTGEIKAVWIACTNPAHSLPNQAAVRDALRTAEYVVLQEAYGNTDTAEFADLLLPASSWGEKHGTVTNSERCITRVRSAVEAPGEARHDWEIVVDFARRLGRQLDNKDVERLFPYAAVEEIFNEHRETTRGRDLDITGLSYPLLETQGPQQWPYPQGAAGGKLRLYEDGRFPTADGRAKFIAIDHQTTADRLDADYPISLLSGRLRDQWHGMSRTGTVPRLFNQEDEPLLAMHPCDMRHRGLETGDIAMVSNRRGEFRVRVAERGGLQKGRVWLPMHWGSQFMNSPGANAVVSDAVDPYSLQPELKHAAVQIRKLDLPYPLAVLRRCSSQAEALALIQRARLSLSAYPYATVGLYGRQNPVVVFRAAAEKAVAAVAIAELDWLFGLDGEAGAIVYLDASRQIAKKAIAENGRLLGVRLAGETLAQAWLKQAMAEDDLDATMIRFALAPTAKPPVSLAPRNIVCKCADVSDVQIARELAQGADLASLQERLKCGSFCGGCIPEIKRMVAEYAPRQAAAA